MSELDGETPTGPLHRVSRGDDAWAWPDWAYAGKDGTFGNRWDDPNEDYRLLYACSQRQGAFVETLARFRPDPHVLAGLQDIEDDEDSEALLPGQVHPSWVWERRIGTATVDGTYAAVSTAAWITHLRSAMAARIIHHGLTDLDAAALRSSAPRRLTQDISRYVYEMTTEDGLQAYDGIRYLSRLGDEFTNWAIFEPADASTWKLISDASCESIETEDEDFLAALEALNLTLVETH